MIPSPPGEPSQAEADSLALPRPNPGPEPWSDEGWNGGWLAVPIVAAGIGLAWLAWSRRRRRGPGRGLAPPRLAADAPPGDRLLALCDHLRADLAARFGPALLARTTEELTADPRVVSLLGDDLPRLAEILAEGDRLKFARRPAADLADRLPGWTAWVGSRR